MNISVLIWNRVRPKCRYKHLAFLFPVSLESYEGERRALGLFLRGLAFKLHNTSGSHLENLVLCILLFFFFLHNSAQHSPFIPRKQHSIDLKSWYFIKGRVISLKLDNTKETVWWSCLLSSSVTSWSKRHLAFPVNFREEQMEGKHGWIWRKHSWDFSLSFSHLKQDSCPNTDY